MAQGEATLLLRDWREGNAVARDRLLELLYADMRRSAAGILAAERGRVALQPTELANESIARLMGLDHLDWQDRAHFMAMAATTMRRVLVDQYRSQNAEKRRGQDVTLATEHLQADSVALDLAALDEALTDLAEVSAALARVVELKFFGGLTNEEAAIALECSSATVKRQWRVARAWLLDYLDLSGTAEGAPC